MSVSLKGLLQKEWVLMRWGLITMFLSNAAIVLLGPTLIRKIFNIPIELFTNALSIVGIWLVFNMFIGLMVMLVSLGHEMKRADIWLHSPLPMIQLIGTKVLFAMLITAASLMLNGLLLGFMYYVTDGNEIIPFADGALALLSIVVAIFLNSIYIMGIGFIIWSIYQVLRSRIGGFAGFVTAIIFFLGAVVWEKLRVSGIFDAIKEFGPVRLTFLNFYDEQNSYFFTGITPDGAIFTIGGLLLYSALTILAFILGSTLFEKKVRL